MYKANDIEATLLVFSMVAISVARTVIPGNRCQVDRTIEETFMKFSKSSCQWVIGELWCISKVDQNNIREGKVF